MARYKFTQNILELSETKDENLLDAVLHKEWCCLGYLDIRGETSQACICNYELTAKLYRFLNIKTKRMINVGSRCYKKFNLSKCRDSTTMFKNFISGHRGEYMEIIDLIEYSDENWRSFLAELNTERLGWTNGDALRHLYSILENLQGMQNKDLFRVVEEELIKIIKDISNNIKHEEDKKKREQEKIVAKERAAKERAEKHEKNKREQERIAAETCAARERAQNEAIKIAQENYVEQQRMIQQEEYEKTKLFNTFIKSPEMRQYINDVMAKNKPFTKEKEKKLSQRLKEIYSRQVPPC